MRKIIFLFMALMAITGCEQATNSGNQGTPHPDGWMTDEQKNQEPERLPSSIEILARISKDILDAGGRILQWQFNEDTDPFVIIHTQGIDVQEIYKIFNQYEFATLLDIQNGVKNGVPYADIYMNAARKEFTTPEAGAFPVQSSTTAIITDLTKALKQHEISIVSEVMPTASIDNMYYTVAYTTNDKSLVSSMEIFTGICNKYQLWIKKMDVSISSDNSSFTVICTLTYCGKGIAALQGKNSDKIPPAFGYKEPIKREWTFIIYMAADNDLESAAIADFNELEAVEYGDAPVSILVLLDRCPGYDMTNGNWVDTRLFEVKPDPKGLTSTIISARIDCPDLGLSKDTETELNTADPLVLSKLIDFAKREYPADQYALFVWGHGTGWRGGSVADPASEPLKAIAFDDTQGQYMSLPSFGRAIVGKGLSLVGFDTCYAAVLEVAYQIRNDVDLFVGSEGEILSTGWDYTALFTDFLKKPALSINALANSIQTQFASQYAGLNNATISQIQLSQVSNLFEKFDVFAGAVADALITEPAKNIALNQVLNNIEKYHFTSFPSDLYIDIFDFSQKIAAIRSTITADTTRQANIASAASALEAALTSAVPSSWAKNGTTKKIGVHVIPLQGMAVPAALHELAYIKGSMTIDKSAFVEASQHWVPNSVPQGSSLLDKLFYWTY